MKCPNCHHIYDDQTLKCASCWWSPGAQLPGLLYLGALMIVALAVVFFVGLAAEVLNVVGQVAVLFLGGQTALRWIIIGSASLTIVLASVFVERQRERLNVRAQSWRESLAMWD